MLKQISYTDIIGTIVVDSASSLPIGFIDDVIINPDNLKIDSFLIKSSFLGASKIIKPSSIIGNIGGEEISISESSLIDVESSKSTKKILEENIQIIWNDVKNEDDQNIGTVIDFVFNPISFDGLFIIAKKSFFKLFYYGSSSIIYKEKIIEIKKKFILIKNKLSIESGI